MKKKGNLHILEFDISADLRVKIQKTEKRDKYIEFARELRKLSNVKVTVIPIVINTIGMIPKPLERGLEELDIRECIENMQTKLLLSLAGILKEFWKTEVTCHLNSIERHYAEVNNSPEV